MILVYQTIKNPATGAGLREDAARILEITLKCDPKNVFRKVRLKMPAA